MFKKILVGLDGSDATRHALERALDLAVLTGATVDALSVEERLPAYAATVGEVAPWLADEARTQKRCTTRWSTDCGRGKDAEALYDQVVDRFMALANGFLERLTRSGVDSLGVAYSGLMLMGNHEGFRIQSRFYFTSLVRLAAPVAPGRWLLDIVSPRAAEHRRVARDAKQYLGRLLDVNAAGVTQDVRERVCESRRMFQVEARASGDARDHLPAAIFNFKRVKERLIVMFSLPSLVSPQIAAQMPLERSVG